MDRQSARDGAVTHVAADACPSPARRSFLVGTAALASSTLLLSACGGGGSTRTATPTYFTTDERAFVRAAVDRLVPKDALGPGGIEAGIDVFIDAQLAGPFGQASDTYMRGPFRLGSTEQGYQLPFTPAQVYRLGIARVDAHCRKTLNAPFASLKPGQQDQVLHDLEDGKVDFGEIPPTNFFDLLLRNTKEGFLADPIYGGNRDFAGWKLIGYRGPRYNYLDEVEKFGKPYDAPYVSLGGEHPVMCRLSKSPTGRFDGPGCNYAEFPPKAHYDALENSAGTKKWPAGEL